MIERTTEITVEAIKYHFMGDMTDEALDAFRRKNLRKLVRENYDEWFYKMRPILRSRDLGFYEWLVSVLSTCGYGDLEESALHSAFAAERARRKKLGIRGRLNVKA